MKDVEILDRLKNIELKLSESSDADSIMDFENALKFLHCSKSYLYKLTSSRKIPFFKPTGKKIYFSKMELLSWIKEKPCRTLSDIEKESISFLNCSKKIKLS